jgi:hypothetical protein
MGKKAKGDHTAKSRAIERPLLDDADRLPLTEALVQFVKRTDSLGLAIREMEQALAQDRMPVMAQSVATGEKQWVEASMWPELRLYSQTPAAGGWCIAYRKPDPSYVGGVKLFLPGSVFFVSQATYKMVWPSADMPPVKSDTSAGETRTLPRLPPGRKPMDDWPNEIAKWLVAVAAEDAKRLQHVDELVGEAREFFQPRGKKLPEDDKALRKRIRELLEYVFP